MSEFNLKKYISNNPLITEGKEEKVDEVVNEELDLVNVYDKNNKKIIGTGRVVQSEKPNPFDVIVQFDRDLVLTFPRDRVKPVKEEVNEMDLRKGDVVKFKDGSRIIIVGPKGDGFDYVDGKDKRTKGYHPAKWFAKMLSTGKAIILEEEELTFTPSSGTKAGGTFSLNNRKYELTSPVKDVTISGRYITDLPKGTILYNLAGGLLADHESLRKFETNFNQYFDKDDYSGIMIRKDKEVLNNIIKNSKVLEFYR